MANEHGAFFDIDYLLASSLMEDEQKAAVARAVDVPDPRKDLDGAKRAANMKQSDMKEVFKCNDCSTQFAAKTVFIQHVSKGCKKVIMKDRFSCTKCEKTYSSKQKLKVHIENNHAELDGSSEIKEEILMDQPKHEEFDVNSTMEEMSFNDGPELHSTLLQETDVDGGDMANHSLGEDSLLTNSDLNAESVITGENILTDSKPPKNITCVLCDKKFRTDEGLNLHIAKKHSKADKEEHSPNNSSLNSSDYGIDTSQSEYLTKNSTVITKARGASINLFNQDAKGLPEGWKSRTIEAKDSSRGIIIKKHFLTPTCIVLKTGLAVVEFLRLGGTMEMERILEVAKDVLHIKEKTLKKVLGDSPIDIPQTCNVTLGC